jgi:predicted RNA-binding protein YlxR (DUF448 family)
MSVAPLSIITTNIPTNARVLSSPSSSGGSSTPRITRNREKSRSNDSTFDVANRRPTYSPDFDCLDYEIRKENLTRTLTEQITEKLTKELTEKMAKKLTDELSDKVCNVMKQHMLDTLSSINIKHEPPPKKCCIIA